ncbi:MAG: class I SAM-dependent methyltransferase [SAR202 cluster bacterium]|nr:class I SAM-dependent methyltransferase [SAR202 cluster bacterium]
MPFGQKVFDAAPARFVFCSMSDPVRSVRELCRVVRAGGWTSLADQVRVEDQAIGIGLDLLDRF